MPEGKKNPSPQKASPAGETSPPRPAPKDIRAALARKPTRKIAREMLVLEVRRLRALFTEIAERYVANTEGKIVAAIEAVEGKPLPPAKVGELLKLVRDCAVKPQKGRRKDLARIEKVAASIREELGE
jgi:hypothetical protein